MHIEYARPGTPPGTAYEVTLVSDTGTVAARIISQGDGLTIHPAAGYSVDSWTNAEQTETRIELRAHNPKDGRL